MPGSIVPRERMDSTSYGLGKFITARFTLPVVLFVVSLFLVYPYFLVDFNEINPTDEAAYVNSGRLLLDKGIWPEYSGNPLVDVFYAATYLPFRSSPDWLAESCSLGRFFLFSLVFTSTYLVAKSFARFAPPIVAAGLLVATPLSLEILHYPSDPLFASLAGFSFYQLRRFYHTEQSSHLRWASFWMGLAALARNDGLFSFAILFVLAVLLSLFHIKDRKPIQLLRRVLSVSLPFILLVGGYLLLYGMSHGSYDLGTMRRTYENFEAGHLSIYPGTGQANPVVEARLEARRVFGTPAENNFSIFTAIRRNPAVYGQRLLATLKELPADLLQAYGTRFTFPLLLLAARGLFEILNRKRYWTALMVLAWPAHLLTGLAITLIRPGHLMFAFYLVFTLAAIGVWALVTHLQSARELPVWLLYLGILAALALVAGKPAVYYGAVVFMVAVVVLGIFAPKLAGQHAQALLVLLCAALIIRGNLPTPRASVGLSGREQGVRYLLEHYPEDTKVAAAAPSPVWNAKMDYTSLVAPDLPREKDSQAFLTWLKDREVQVIFVDNSLIKENPAVWAKLEAQIGIGLERLFYAPDGNVQVLNLR